MAALCPISLQEYLQMYTVWDVYTFLIDDSSLKSLVFKETAVFDITSGEVYQNDSGNRVGVLAEQEY